MNDIADQISPKELFSLKVCLLQPSTVNVNAMSSYLDFWLPVEEFRKGKQIHRHLER